MKRLLGWFIEVPKALRPACPHVHALMSKNTSFLRCKSSSQGGRVCNGTKGKKPLQSDPQLFEAQFEELVLELTEKDIADPALADALSRLREVCVSRPGSAASERLEQLLYVCVSILLGAGVQCSRREEKPRAVCDWFAERASPPLRAHAGHGAASPVGWMVHRISKTRSITHCCNYLKVSYYERHVFLWSENV